MEAEEEGCQKKGMTHNLASHTNIRVRHLTQMWTMTLAWPPTPRTDFIVYQKNMLSRVIKLYWFHWKLLYTYASARAHTVTFCFTFSFLFFIHVMKCVDESSTLPLSGDENAQDSYQNKTQDNHGNFSRGNSLQLSDNVRKRLVSKSHNIPRRLVFFFPVT